VAGEVVNTDAMQLYRGMDVGTAKHPVDERGGVPHHLLDLLEVTQSASVAHFQRLAREVIAQCRARSVVPVLVGGSALYTRAVLDRFDFPGTDPAVRERWQRRLDEVGAEALHRELREVDPEAAEQILPGNSRRIVRALEVVELTGRPFSATLPRQEYVDPATVQIGLDCPRGELDRRIEARVRRMWDGGLLDEVRDLERQGLREGLTASRALGYQQVLAHLAGECTEQEAYEATVRGTRRFARRQDSWFRKDPRIVWVAHDDPDRVDRAVAAVEALLE
jgi:tRNA dimethylallyltransferase